MKNIIEYLVNNHITNKYSNKDILDNVLDNMYSFNEVFKDDNIKKICSEFIHFIMDDKIFDINTYVFNNRDDVKKFCNKIFINIPNVINNNEYYYRSFYNIINYIEDEYIKINDFNKANQVLENIMTTYAYVVLIDAIK